MKVTPVYITPEERQKGEAIERKTKAEVKEEIKKMLDSMGSAAHDFSSDYKRLSSSTLKDTYIKLYYDVLERYEEDACVSAEVDETDFVDTDSL